jgi:ribose/xylose/arabinose/galactoside ABC-type transport system permease subunit
MLAAISECSNPRRSQLTNVVWDESGMSQRSQVEFFVAVVSAFLFGLVFGLLAGWIIWVKPFG